MKNIYKILPEKLAIYHQLIEDFSKNGWGIYEQYVDASRDKNIRKFSKNN